MDSGPQFDSVSLTYGCHDHSFELCADGSPVLITGPNGSGKTTLVEGLLRILFGFNRKIPQERETLRLRQPWSGGSAHGELHLRIADIEITVARDFETDQVTVRSGGSGEALFEDTARPGGSSPQDREYRRLLRGWLGFERLKPFTSTVWIRQGDLAGTELSDELLRIADGGHRAVEQARSALLETTHELSSEPFPPGARKRSKAGRVERLAADVQRARQELSAAEARQHERKPLLGSRDRLDTRVRRLESEIEALEGSLGPLARRATLEAELREMVRVHRQAEELHSELRDTRQVLRAAEVQADEVDSQQRYPADFERRIASLRALWDEKRHREAELSHREAALSRREPEPSRREPELDRLEAAVPRVLGFPLPSLLVAAAFAVGLGVAVTGRVGGGAVVALSGLALAVLLGTWARRVSPASTDTIVKPVEDTGAGELESPVEMLNMRISDLDKSIVEQLQDVPEAATLTLDTAPDRLRHFKAQEGARTRLAQAEARMAEQTARVEAFLEGLDLVSASPPNSSLQVDFFGASNDSPRASPAGAPDASPAGAPDASPAGSPDSSRGDPGPSHERRLSETLRSAVRESATLQIRLDDVSLAGHALPDGIERTPEAVEMALVANRTELREAMRERTELDVRLATSERGADSSVALAERVGRLAGELAAAETETRALQLAYELVGDAHERFQAEDQTRLLRMISGRLEELTAGRLGPVESGDTLADAQVRQGSRQLPLSSPPLSYGELHSVLLAVRLGSADFLADLKIQPPLLVDEPFAYLDVERASEVWQLLCEIARSRQVIVTSQDRLILEHLGARSSLQLPEIVV